MSKKAEDIASTTVVDEANPPEVIQLDDHFWRHKSALLWCSVACIGGFQLGNFSSDELIPDHFSDISLAGLDLGSIAGLQAMPGFLQVFGYKDPTAVFGYNIDSTVQQLISSLMSLGAFLTCALVGPVGKFLNRKWTFILAILFNQVGVIMMMLSPNVKVLYVARTITGLANGLFDVVPQLYIHECASATQRGPLLGWFNVLVSLGLLIGSIVDNFTSTMLGKKSYYIPLGLFFIMPTVLLMALPFLPESPRWLVEHNKRPQARDALVRLRSKDTSPHIIDSELEEICEALEREKELAKGAAYLDLFRGTNLRRTLLSFALLIGLTGTGSLFFLVYGTYFFAMAGQSAAFEESVGTTLAGLVGTALSMWLITVLSRRTILLLGFAVQGICMLLIAVVYTANPLSLATGRCLVAFVVIYLFFYNMCCAPYLYLVGGELPSQRLRGYTLGPAIAIAFVGNWLASYTAPYFINTAQLNWVCNSSEGSKVPS